ncbi:TetR/AcrR family transcriptional regulator [Streptomyces sp. Lzd4kr]|nr:TetR/AcrR family transcriptional regulator [Streptomyces sp. Lzd4kr]
MPSSALPPRGSMGRPLSAEGAILAAAQRLLDDGVSFTELGVQWISVEAGVSRSSFYVHFRDKIDLLMRLAEQFLVPAFDASSAWRPSDGPEALTETFLNVLVFYRQHAAVRRALAEAAAYDATAGQAWGQEIAQFTGWTLAVLSAEQQAGRTPSDVDALSATQVIVTGGERAIVEHITTRPPGSDPVFARELALIWWYGVYRRPTGDTA